MSSFCKCKSSSHFFFSKNISVNAIFNDESFNNTWIMELLVLNNWARKCTLSGAMSIRIATYQIADHFIPNFTHNTHHTNKYYLHNSSQFWLCYAKKVIFYNTLGDFSRLQTDDIFFSPENRLWHFMLIVIYADNLHKMQKSVFWGKKNKNYILKYCLLNIYPIC